MSFARRYCWESGSRTQDQAGQGPSGSNYIKVKSTGEVGTTSSEEEVANNTVENTADASITENEVLNEKSAEKAEHNKLDHKLAENTSDIFNCLICDFSSTWENGLSVHMGRKHGNLEQLDGEVDIDEIELDKKYDNTEHYWAKGRLGVIYITFLDANSIIDRSKLPEDEKKKEKEKILEARKAAFGSSFHNFPPWNKKSK